MKGRGGGDRLLNLVILHSDVDQNGYRMVIDGQGGGGSPGTPSL